MANIHVYRIEYIQSPSGGSFVSGDVLDVYIDTDLAVGVGAGFQTAGLSVELNNVNYPSIGADFLSGTPNVHYIIQDFSPQICIGTSLLGFIQFIVWPFATYVVYPDHYSCTINPPTCDLIIVGVPQVIPATAEDLADGSVRINATSSNPIEYKLGSDFIYGDGTAQSSGFFIELVAGDYRIFLRDSKNCAVNILVSVGISNVFGPRFRLDYTDYRNRPTRVDVVKRGYEGTIDEVCGASDPFLLSLRGETSQDKGEPILATQGVLNLVSMINNQFSEIYTNDPNLYRIHYYKDLGTIIPGVIFADVDPLSAWVLDLDPDGYQVYWSYVAPNLRVQMSGVKNSNFAYTDYAFESGKNYSFNYSFTVSSSGFVEGKNIYIRICGEDNLASLLETEIAITALGVVSGTWDFVSPESAGRIAIYIKNVGPLTTYLLTLFEANGGGTASAPAGYELQNVLKVLPMQWVEDFKAPPYYGSVTATDGLPELTQLYLVQADGHRYYGEEKLIKIIAMILKELRLDLNIRVACNLYAVNMDQNVSDDPFDQAFVDYDLFYLANPEPTLAFTLISILEAFGAQIIQAQGRWNIIRAEERSAAYAYRDFDSDGNYMRNGVYDPVVNIEFPSENGDVMLVNADHVIENKPGYGQIEVLYRLGLRPNILQNGDFRLRSRFVPPYGYIFDLNKDGWVLVNAGYVLSESFEYVTATNVAYKIETPDLSILTNTNGGNAYIQSAVYNVKMGTNNQLKISFTVKVQKSVQIYESLVLTIEVPYVKARIRVKYGSLYLQSDGSWSSSENILTFRITEWNKYTDFDITAFQPDTGTPVEGMDFDVRVYHTYAFHPEFQDVDVLKAFPTYDSGLDQQIIPTGYKTELRDVFTLPANLYYLELEETTDAENLSGYIIVRPDDYHVTDNPRQWVLKKRQLITVANNEKFPMFLDKVVVKFLTNGEDSIDTIQRKQKGEGQNKDVFTKTLIIGSYSNLIVTERKYSFGTGVFFPSYSSIPGIAATTLNVLSAGQIYAGYLRSSTGEGYEFWARDGVAESDKLHGIWLKQYAKQYQRSWQLFRGSLYAKNRYASFIDTFRLVADNNVVFIPIGLELNDKKCMYSGEMLELITDTTGSDGGGSSPYSSAFSIGFGSGGFN